MLALDVSRSMKATDVEPTRLDAARIAAKTFLDDAPEKFRVGVVRSRPAQKPSASRRPRIELVVTALDTLAPGEGTPSATRWLCHFVSVSYSHRRRESDQGGGGGDASRDRLGRAHVDGQIEPAEAAKQAKERGVPVYYLSSSGRRKASSRRS